MPRFLYLYIADQSLKWDYKNDFISGKNDEIYEDIMTEMEKLYSG